MLAAASSYLSRSALNTNYTIHNPAQPGSFAAATEDTLRRAREAAERAASSPAFGRSQTGGSTTPLPAPGSEVTPFSVGLWKIVRATNKTTHKVVSVWMFEKKALETLKNGKELVLAVLRKEATSLSRLRHPCILEMVEPMEETRSEITFATEPITSSLSGTLASARPGGVLDGVDLDETEIQKGILQIAHGLSFLHTQAKLIHNNLSPDAIYINAKGDWKLGALNMTTSLESSERWTFPEYDARMPESVQRKFDYMDPEYALDERLTTASDLYALGCVLYAVHLGGRPPFQNHNSLQTLRQNADRLARGDIGSSTAMAKLGNDLKDLLSHLITRTSANRLSALTLPSQPFFSNLAISTLLFLDRSTFSSKPKEEKATFLRGLLRVLPNFSERLRKRKILPSLLEEMKDPWLLPFLLPNVFEIAKTQSKDEFNAATLPALQPLFALTDPPQNMLTLLDSLPLFIEKTSSTVFREHIMPLIYNSLDSEHPEVQERALKSVPSLLDVLDVGSIQEVLFVKVAILFTKTRVLSVKVKTLECFLSMIKVLDKVSLTQKLVPLLAKIKTKEPDVMMATLAVHEAMGVKVDREAVATLVLPQLWSFSMGPLLNVEQFGRFMATIKTLGARIEQEHAQHLRENHRIQSQTTSYASNGNGSSSNGAVPEVSFESLVNGTSRSQAPPQAPNGGIAIASDPWGDDPWDSVPVAATPSFTSPPPQQVYSPPPPIQPSPLPPPSFSRNSSTSTHAARVSLGARSIPSSTFNSAAFPTPPPPSPLSSFQPLSPTSSHQPSLPTSFPTLYPTSSSISSSSSSSQQQQPSRPNYNVTLPPMVPKPTPLPTFAPPPPPQLQSTNSFSSPPLTPNRPPQQAAKPPPGYSFGVMQPTSTAKPAQFGSAVNQKAVADEFDPFA